MTRVQQPSPEAVELDRCLAALDAGPVPPDRATEVIERLDRAWSWLTYYGLGPHMPGSLSFREATDVHWEPPVLSFQLVRRGTKYEKLERWTVDTHTWRRGFKVLERQEFVTPAQLAADALAAELAPLIASRQPDPRLHWTKAGRVRVRIRRIFDVKANRESTRWRAMIDSRIGRHLQRTRWRLRNDGWWEPAGFWRTPAGRRCIAGQLARAIMSGRHDLRLDWVDRSTVNVRFKRVTRTRRTNIPEQWRNELLGDIARELRRSGWVPREQESFIYQEPFGVVGWMRSYRGVGRVCLCLACAPACAPGSSEPIHIDAVRPQGQSCHTCGGVMVTPVLDGLPEWYERRR